MNKYQLQKEIQSALEKVYQTAKDAAQRAYDTATDEENEAENKYDTLGLEASYLAHGQSKRVAECEADLITFKKLDVTSFANASAVSMGALVCIEDETGAEQFIFISPVAGGLKIHFDEKEIYLITRTAPICKALLKKFIEDEIEVTMGSIKKHYLITAIY